MQSLKIKIGVGILIIFMAGVFFIASHSANTDTYQAPVDDTTTTTPTKTPSPIPTPAPTVKTYSMTEVATHKNAQSCWTTINGNVYDVTSWISQHPGGAQAILSLCGNDGTAAFTAQHGGQRRPESELKTFLIGKLQ